MGSGQGSAVSMIRPSYVNFLGLRRATLKLIDTSCMLVFSAALITEEPIGSPPTAAFPTVGTTGS